MSSACHFPLPAVWDADVMAGAGPGTLNLGVCTEDGRVALPSMFWQPLDHYLREKKLFLV